MTAPATTASTRGELAFGLVLVALGVVALTQVRAIAGNEGWAVSGPRFVPLLVCAAWVLLSVVYVVQVFRRLGGSGEFDRTAALLMATLIGYAYVVIPLGYVLSTAVSFVLTARILGSRKVVRDVVAGVVMALVVYFAFTELLSIRLPRGVLPL
ncbi:tripartite tricarboxylate transporter TctB family protein [Lentzea tibetensis]|uniref:tripartite tricarboxylate transporter TctB family protein n=1 Tax=Lentzea tibetensis TaxID=2591470 RepID=UPI0016493204|nr:tripartite tricarboxylate transporter TctB family protein [Lentzea tibetensis]